MNLKELSWHFKLVSDESDGNNTTNEQTTENI